MGTDMEAMDMATVGQRPMAIVMATDITVMDIVGRGAMVMDITDRGAIGVAIVIDLGVDLPAKSRGLITINKKIGRMVIAAIVLVVSLPISNFPLVAGPFTNVDTAYQLGDYETALALLQPMVDQGHAAAQSRLGVMYFDGHGVLQDYSEAVKWYRRAAEKGDTSAQSYLGFMYLKGRGVPQDYAEALKWARPAADRGNARAQYTLGLMYEHGDGLDQDYMKAYLWLNLAAAGFTEAEVDLRFSAVSDRDSVANRMTQAQIMESQRLAHDWKAQ
jgi:TPR repeat protein